MYISRCLHKSKIYIYILLSETLLFAIIQFKLILSTYVSLGRETFEDKCNIKQSGRANYIFE